MTTQRTREAGFCHLTMTAKEHHEGDYWSSIHHAATMMMLEYELG